MKTEFFKAADSDEIVWLRLNRLRSVKLCEDHIRVKLISSGDLELDEEQIKAKAIGLSSAVDSALGYWKMNTQGLNARVLSRYYFLLQLTIAEQVGSVNNKDDLKTIQKHTESGHGLKIVRKTASDFPDDYCSIVTPTGHFYSYAKFLGIDVQKCIPNSGKTVFNTEPDKAINIIELFRRIPELRNVIEEYTGEPPLCFHVGHADWNRELESKLIKDHIDETGELIFSLPKDKKNPWTYIELYDQSNKLTTDYLESLNLPFVELEQKTQVNGRLITIGKLNHPNDLQWFEYLKTYRSSYAPETYITPLWNETKDSIVINFILLHSLSIIVRYLPELWYRINSGDLSHYGSLIEYYISIIDHVLPHQMLERITDTKLKIEQPGSIYGQI